MLPRSDIEAIDRPTMLSILYSTISVQQTNLLPAKRFPKRRHISHKSISDHLAMVKFLWLRNHRTVCTLYSTIAIVHNTITLLS